MLFAGCKCASNSLSSKELSWTLQVLQAMIQEPTAVCRVNVESTSEVNIVAVFVVKRSMENENTTLSHAV